MYEASVWILDIELRGKPLILPIKQGLTSLWREGKGKEEPLAQITTKDD